MKPYFPQEHPPGQRMGSSLITLTELTLPRGEKLLGLVHVYTGNGKGKTTSALGLALRASGHEMRTLFVQFLKGRESGEVKALKGNKFIDIETFGTGEFFTESKRDLFLEYCRKGLERVRNGMRSGRYHIIVLDEVNVAMHLGLIEEKEILSLMETSRELGVELILTGRNAPKSVIERADLVTEMVEVKHPYNSGVKARMGIEW